MERTTLAVAMVLVVAGLSAGLSTVPGVLASSSVCDEDDFDIPDIEPSDNNARPLKAGQSEVGVEDVTVSIPETLHVEMVDKGANGQLNYSVWFLDGGQCTQLDPSDCDETLRDDEEKETCELDAPESRDYHVEFEVGNQNDIEYKTWSTTP